jgi:hypothetical protein
VTATFTEEGPRSLASPGRVEGGDGIVEDSHVADVCPEPTIPDPLDDLTQLGAIGYDEVLKQLLVVQATPVVLP